MKTLLTAQTLGTLIAGGPLLAIPVTGLVAKPDLVASARPGWRENAARLVIEIANVGFGRARPFEVRVIIAGRCGTRVIHYKVLGVEPRGSAFLEADATDPCPGARRIEVDVDPDNQVSEADEENNRGLVMTAADSRPPVP